MKSQSYAQIVKLHLSLIKNAQQNTPENTSTQLKILTDYWFKNVNSAHVLTFILLSQQQLNKGCLRAIKSIALLKLLAISLNLPATLVKTFIYLFLAKELYVARYLQKPLSNEQTAPVLVKLRQSIALLYKHKLINIHHVKHLKLSFIRKPILDKAQHSLFFSQTLFLYITKTIDLITPISQVAPIITSDNLLLYKCKNEQLNDTLFNDALYQHLQTLIGNTILIEEKPYLVIRQEHEHLDLLSKNQAQDVQPKIISLTSPTALNVAQSTINLPFTTMSELLEQLNKKEAANLDKQTNDRMPKDEAFYIDYEKASNKEITNHIEQNVAMSQAITLYAESLLIKANTVNSINHALAIIGRERLAVWSLRFAIQQYFIDHPANHASFLHLIMQSVHDEIEQCCRKQNLQPEEYKLFIDCCLLPIFSLINQQISTNIPVAPLNKITCIYELFKINTKQLQQVCSELARVHPNLKNYIKLAIIDINGINKLSSKQQNLFFLSYHCILTGLAYHIEPEQQIKINQLKQIVTRNNHEQFLVNNIKGYIPIHYNQN